MKKKLKKYNMGGELLTTAAPQLLGTGLNALVPGLGSIAAPMASALIGKAMQQKDEMKVMNDHFKAMSTSTNPYGNYALGGELEGGMYDGASHEQGGIQVDSKGTPSSKPVAEVEDGEVVVKLKGKSIILSSKLRI
jgi:hypothetical protein